MNQSSLKAALAEYGLYPNKRLGQHFLVSEKIRNRIIDAISPHVSDKVLEIGPGLGALTELLVERAGSVTAVEIDAGFVRYLASRFSGVKSFALVHGDILRVEVGDDFTLIVSNLPYYCASEILFRLARLSAPRMFVMLPDDIAERITSLPGSRSYGAVSVTISLYYDTTILFSVPRDAFYPRPDVRSAFISLKRRVPLPLENQRLAAFHDLVRSAFWGRRKTIAKALAESPHLDLSREEAEALLAATGIDSRARGEDLSVEDYIALARAFGETRPAMGEKCRDRRAEGEI